MLAVEFHNSQLAKELQRLKEKYKSHTDTPKSATNGIKPLSVSNVLDAHFMICDRFTEKGLFKAGPRDEGLFLSTVYKQYAGYGGEEKYEDTHAKSAALLYGIIKNHCFYDANKRTGLLCCLLMLYKNEWKITATEPQLEKLALDIASGNIETYPEYKKHKGNGLPKDDAIHLCIRKELRDKTKKIEKERHVEITFGQLNTCLNAHGFALENPKGNRIEVVTLNRGGLIARLFTKKRLGNIDYPGDKKTVSRSQLKSVRELCKLDEKNGFDCESFIGNAIPVSELIKNYWEVLNRLSTQ